MGKWVSCPNANIINLSKEGNQWAYSIFIYGVTQKELPYLPQRIRERLKQQLIYDEFNIAQITEMLAFSEAFSYFKSSDRKVLGIMNDMVHTITLHIELGDEIDERKLSSRINRTPYKVGNFSYPKDALREML